MQQSKLVRCVSGKVYEVIMDLRKDSPTFGKYQGFYLSGENLNELLVPAGFGHGYLVIEDSIVSYKCSEKIYGEYDSGIRYDDPDLGIVWPYDEIGGKDKVINSIKDDNLQSFKEFIENYNEFLK
jgi:dTDP-4-dehydrorhamnose 3,5-epimerase